jgi:hypothetical protein
VKNIKLIDALPSLFGAIAIMGILVSTAVRGNALGFLALLGGAVAALGTSVVSVFGAKRTHTTRVIYILNVAWLVVTGLFLVGGILLGLTWNSSFY